MAAVMRAWQVAANGEPGDVMSLVETEVPTPGPSQLLVRVRASALNFPDVLLVRGQYQVRPPLPFTPGVELCGEVVAAGAEVTGFTEGDRVIGTTALPSGALAEYALVEAVDAFPAPAALDDVQASAMHIAYQTGWFSLHRRARLQPGETLLIHAGAGGVGSAAIQLGKAAGATVIAVVGGAAKAEVAAKLGADLVVDRREQDFIAAVKAATGGRGADVVFDPVGGDAYTGSVKCVAFEGRILVVGFAGGTVPTPGLNHALVKNYSIVGVHWGLYRQLNPALVVEVHEKLCGLAADGVVQPLIGGVLSLDEAVDGLTRLGAGETVGRLVVRP
ncbi:NADPH:quinone oxidoreductase family protein [Catellatospora paridis]|uniref:NADPH:quinone oxidoreductase family protein n=1 Tax=Catellatospora paridis TaxID=1617086 RepID=UPI001E42E77B|nr:NADPH:quinone oxidoreductase family protein [Catellatospora paridis]